MRTYELRLARKKTFDDDEKKITAQERHHHTARPTTGTQHTRSHRSIFTTNTTKQLQKSTGGILS